MKILKQAEKKTYQRDAALTHTVMDIIENVQTNGDKALIEYAAKFDHMDIDTVRISPEQVKAAYEQVDEETIETLRFAAGQIRFFAEKQRECLKDLNIPSRVEGVEIGHRMIPVDRCGCYVPGWPPSAAELRADGHCDCKGGWCAGGLCLLSGIRWLWHNSSGGTSCDGYCWCG